MADWVELRVHGVSGTPPESMLASPYTRQVAGDDRSRFFRPVDAHDREVPGHDGQVVEAFHWGRWTSGSWTQALWILLIPFGIANAAQFMLSAPAEDRRSRAFHGFSGAMLRLLALSMTALFAVAAAVVVIDLVAWQWLAVKDLPGDARVVVAPAVLAAAGVVYLLSRLARVRAGRRRYGVAEEAAGLPGLKDTAFFDGDPDNPSLRHLHLAAAMFLISWVALSAAADSRPGLTDVARWVPVAGTALTVAVVVLLGDPERTTTVGEGRGTVRRWWHGIADDGTVRAQDPPSQRVSLVLHVAGVACVLAGAAAVAFAPVDESGLLPGAHGRLPGMEVAAAAAGIGGTVAILLLLVAVRGLARTTRSAADGIPEPFRRFAGGMTPWLASSVGFFLGIGLTAGLALTVQGVLNRLPATTEPVRAPDVLQRVSFSWGVTAVVMAGLGVWAVVHLRRRRMQFVAAAAAAFTFGGPPDDERPRLPPEWLRRVGGAMQRARLKNHLELVFWVFGLLGLVLAAAAAIDYLVEAFTEKAEGPVLSVIDLFTGVSSLPGDPVRGDDLVIGLGQVVLLGLAGGAVLLARGAIRAEGPRRALNVVWDVVAFWPRSVHPFVPPPYAQEVVPALVRRICWHLGGPDPMPDAAAPDAAPHVSATAVNPDPAGTVVLAAHSQGSLISLAALLRLPADVRTSVKWVTFGSQLRQQFPRAFPHYVRYEDLRSVAVTHDWISLYRDTDPIAGPVTSWKHGCTVDDEPASFRLPPPGRPAPTEPEQDWIDPRSGRRVCGREWRLLDPAVSDWRFQTRAVATLQGHSNYWLDPDFDLALDVARGVRSDGRPRAAAGPVPVGDPAPGDGPVGGGIGDPVAVRSSGPDPRR